MISTLTGSKVKKVITFERKVHKENNFIIPLRFYKFEDKGNSFSITD